jgi:Ca-activated chloride channel homolog
MHRLIAVALACAWFIGVGSVVPASAAGPTARTIYVTVVDDQGHPVPGLTPADFVVKEGGKDREIASVASASEKMRVALMVEEPLVGQNQVRVGLADFVSRMCPSAEIALFMAWQRAEKLVDFTSDPNVLINGIRNLPISQGRQSAAVPDAVFELAKQFEKAQHPRPVIVLAVIEQGQSTDDPEGILGQIAKSKAQFWAVSLTTSGVGGTGASAAFGRGKVLGDGSAQSGGRRVPIMTLPGFQQGLQQVADDLSSQYLITYSLPDGVKSSDRISVSLKKPGATLRAPNRVPK